MSNDHLVYNAVPSIAGIVDYNVDLALAKFGRFLHELTDVLVLEHITGYCNGTATVSIDCLRNSFRLRWRTYQRRPAH